MRSTWHITALVAGLLALSLAALVPDVGAEHEPGHRFRISGQVTDDTGAPVCGVAVRATDLTAPDPERNRTAVSDFRGQYFIQLHMHSVEVAPTGNNEGDVVLVTVVGENASRTITAIKSPSSEAWGNAVVDLRIPRRVTTNCQDPLVAAAVNGALYIGVPAGILAAGFVLYRWTRARPAVPRNSVERIPGIGRSKAAQLRSAGVDTIPRLADAFPKDLATATGLPLKETKRLVRKAKEFLEGKRIEAAADEGDET